MRRSLVDEKQLKPADIRGPRSCRSHLGAGIILPKQCGIGLPEMIVDFRQLHTVRMDLLTALCPARPAPRPRSAAVPRASRQALRRYVQPHRPAGTLRDGTMNGTWSRLDIGGKPADVYDLARLRQTALRHPVFAWRRPGNAYRSTRLHASVRRIAAGLCLSARPALVVGRSRLRRVRSASDTGALSAA